jgi:L-cysteine desulfidase
MIAKPEREQIIALINREVVPAIGCTEPIAVALCVAKATETLGKRPERGLAKIFLKVCQNSDKTIVSFVFSFLLIFRIFFIKEYSERIK